jgi:hypothetical protein
MVPLHYLLVVDNPAVPVVVVLVVEETDHKRVRHKGNLGSRQHLM